MKTFGLFILLVLLVGITNSLVLKGWTPPEIVIQSTVIAYILQQYITEEFKKK
jgi:hypothetical protein